MEVKNNYNECITNLACSIRKYFGLDFKHQTLSYIDEILNHKRPKNVVTILCDGMGANIMEKALPKESFLLSNKLKNITTVFPATTVAATTAMITGLNPSETAMLGWYMYYKDIDKTIVTFQNCEKSDPLEKPISQAIIYKNKHMITKSIVSDINDKGINQGYELFPFGPNCYQNVDDMYAKIEKLCKDDGKKYIYAYNNEPDSTMHQLGADSEEAYKIIKNINNDIEALCKKLKDTIVFVIADHGHINVENVLLSDYPQIFDCLERTTSLEPRAVNFFIKDSKKHVFPTLFNELFGEYFDLYNKEEIIKSKLFGDGVENPAFRDILGDYLAIAKSNKAMFYDDEEFYKSQHAGYTDDEIYIPLIKIDI